MADESENKESKLLKFTKKAAGKAAEKLGDAIDKSKVIDVITHTGMTALVGPLAADVSDTVGLNKLSSKDIGDAAKKVAESPLMGVKKAHQWFYKMSPKEQKEYLREHPDSEFNQGDIAVPTAPLDPVKKSFKPKSPSSTDAVDTVKTLEQINDETKRETERKKKKAKTKSYKKPSRNAMRAKRKLSKTTKASMLVARFLEVALNKSTEDFVIEDTLKALYLVLIYADTLQPAPSNIRNKVKSVSPHVDDFFTQHKIPKLAMTRLLESITSGRAYSAKDEQWLIKLADAMNKNKRALEKNTSIGKEELGLFKSFISYFKRKSDTALKNIDRRVSMFKDPILNAAFHKTSLNTGEVSKSSQTDVKVKLEKLVRKLTSKVSTVITAEDAEKARAKYPEEYKQYLALRREYNQVYKDFIKQYVRASGQAHVDYKKLVTALNKSGIQHNLPDGFDGFVDDQLNYFTTAGIPIKGKPSGTVIMNPTYNPKKDDSYVFTSATPMGQAYFYTTKFKEQKTTSKFAHVSNLEKNITFIQKKWLADLKSGNEKSKIKAAQLQIMYAFGARSGSGTQATGITTLKNKHVKISGNVATISYVGKKGAAQKHVIKGDNPVNNRIIKLLGEKKAQGGPNDDLWTYNSTTQKGVIKTLPVSSTGKYLKTISGEPNAKLHHMRHLLGTKVALDVLKTSPFTKSNATQSKVEAWYKEAMKKVGEVLVHQTGDKVTSTTAIQNYIDPKVQADFFIELGLRVPSWIPRTTTTASVKVGKHNELPDSEFDPEELKRGIEVEMEHTDNPFISKNITKDHLTECEDYYTRLDEMEKKCSKETAAPYDLPIHPYQKRVAAGNKCIGYIVMSPEKFLDLTTIDATNKQKIIDSAQPLDVYVKSIRTKNNLVMPFLNLEVKKLGDMKGEVVGHEGRHRAAALMKAGKKRMPVAISIRPENREKAYRFEVWEKGGKQTYFWDKSIIPEKLKGQFNSKSHELTSELKTFVSFYNKTISHSEAKDLVDTGANVYGF